MGTCGARGLQHHPQTLQVLSQQGESLLSLAQELGMRIFNRHVVQRKQLNDEVQALQERYFRYLLLLASDTQVRSGGRRNEELLLGLGFGGSSGREHRWVSR